MSEWIKHDGGPCPVVTPDNCFAKYRDGEIRPLQSYHSDPLFWEHMGNDCDIIAYRLVEIGQ